jgi:hypothetical protein
VLMQICKVEGGVYGDLCGHIHFVTCWLCVLSDGLRIGQDFGNLPRGAMEALSRLQQDPLLRKR